MKPLNIILLIVGIFLVFGCSKEEEINQTSTVTEVKLSASDIAGEYNTVHTLNGYTSRPYASNIVVKDSESQFTIKRFTKRNIDLNVNMNGSTGKKLSFDQVSWGNRISGEGLINENGTEITLDFQEETGIGTFYGNVTLTKK